MAVAQKTDQDTLVEALINIAGEQDVVTGRVAMYAYGYDATLLFGVPRAVVFPESTQEVVDIVNYCRATGVNIVPRGAGTNESGGTIPVDNCIIMNCCRMKKVLEVDLDNYVAIIEPGVVNYDIQEMLAKYGYYYPPDPASYKASTMGGNVGECSGGPKCFKYGVTRDYIYGMEFVTSDGKVRWVGGRDFCSEPFYDLTRIMCGSEGTLGYMTKFAIRIEPIPAAKRTMLAFYNEPVDAAQSVADIVAAGIVPTTLEMMDNLIINTAEDATGAGLPRDAGAMLIIEVDGPAYGDLDDQVKTITEVVKKAKPKQFKIATTAAEVDACWLARRVAIGSVAHRAPSYSMQDITVPRSKFPQAVAGIVQTSKDYDLDIGILAHAGDGNFHPLVLFDQRNKEQSERVHKAEAALVKMALDLGGTMSGEHGVGLLKKPLLPNEYEPVTMGAFRNIKRAFDPINRMNPTKIFDL
ncbi:MAG: FAD-binding protein [Gracilibacteraceae bacterium]|jgi:glycolate oxidase|nr:FAD-binding protein [Gracilibacteraceae bacterium]